MMLFPRAVLLSLLQLLLLQARQFGTYLIAGVHGDDVVNARRGLNMPIMNLNERVLR
jgi:glycerol-3-phosphate cytidylyltransferase-like family protein